MGVSSGYFTTNNYQGRYLQFDWYLVSQDITNNYSIIHWTWTGRGQASSSWYYMRNSYVNVYGANRYSQDSGSIRLYDGTEVASGDITIWHDNNGNASFGADGGAGIHTNAVNCTGSGDWDLPQIPRQATIYSAYDFTDEQNPTITYKNPANFYINARLEFADSYIHRENIPNTGSYTFELTTEERNLLRQKCTGNSMVVRQIIATKINSQSETHWSFVDKTMYMVNANPTFSNFDYEDTNSTTLALTGNNKSLVKGYSNIKAIISSLNKAIGQKYATMSKYRFSVDNQSVDIAYSDNQEVNGIINNVTSDILNVYAIDSRNNSTLVTKLANPVINYEPIQINTLQAKATRDNNGSGIHCNIEFSGSFWNENFGLITNTIKSVTYKFKKTTSSTWIDGTTTITPTITNNIFSFNGLIGSDEQDQSWNLGDSYNIKIIITDELSSKELDLILISAKPNLALHKDGVAINQGYDETLGGDLQLCEGNVFGGKVLYNNASGTNGTVTLSDNSAKYDFIDISIKNNQYNFETTVRIYNPNGKTAILSTAHAFFQWATFVSDSRQVTISGNTISDTQDDPYGKYWSYNNTVTANNNIFITKVVGYRKE